MQAGSQPHGLISYDRDEFLHEYGDPEGKTFTVEVTHDGKTYIYADVVGEIQGDKVVIDLTSGNLVGERRLH